MAFLNIVPYTQKYMDWNVESIPLRIVYGDGVDYTPDVKVNVTDLNSGNKRFLNVSGKGDRFRVKVLVNKDDKVFAQQVYTGDAIRVDKNGVTDVSGNLLRKKYIKVSEALDYWIRDGETFMVTSDGDAVDIQDGLYIVTGNSSRKQSARGGYSVWDLEFTKHIPKIETGWLVQTGNAKAAVKAYEKQKAKKKKNSSSKTSKAQQSEPNIVKLKKCKVGKGSEIKYSKTKKVTECVKIMQWVLKKKGYYDKKLTGWFDNYTLKCVKQFQTDYNKKKKKGKYTKKDLLRTDGKVDKYVLAALCKA